MIIESEKQGEQHSLSLVLVIGNAHVVGAIFKEELLLERAVLNIKSNWFEELELFLRSREKIGYALLGSINKNLERKISEILHRYEIPFSYARDHLFSLPIDACAEGKMGTDRIADAYGAIQLYPGNRIIVNISTMVAFDVISKEPRFLAGVIYPGMGTSARGLAQQTYLLPYVDILKLQNCGAKTIKDSICSGIYYGLLGAIEKISRLLKNEYFPSEDVTVVATGSSIMDVSDDNDHNVLAEALRKDLTPLVVDTIEPDLALLGLHEMYLEAIK